MPISLLVLVDMVLNRINIKTQLSSASVPQPTFSQAQLLMINCSARRKEDVTACNTKHNHERETPLPIYLGVLVHTKTRKRELVDTLYDMGLSVSYDWVLNISTVLGNNVCRHCEIELAVCPTQLKGGLFMTAAIANIDHNPSSTTSHDSFHGTGISLFQHPADRLSGVQRTVATTHAKDCIATKKTVAYLPHTYTNVPPVAMHKATPPMPKLEGPNKADCQLIPQAMVKEYRYSTNSCVYH